MSRKSLYRRAWKLQAAYILARDGACVTCGATSGLVPGHFKHGTGDFDERNINAQCGVCNSFLNGNPDKYRTYMMARWGRETVEEIERSRHAPHKYTAEKLEQIIAKYKRGNYED